MKIEIVTVPEAEKLGLTHSILLRRGLDINQAAGISTFDLSYRRERYENQTIDRDRYHENLRSTERFQLWNGTSVWFDGILTKNTLALPAGRSFESTYRQFSGNALSRVSKRLQGSVRYAYVDNAVAGRTFSLHTVQASVHYSIRTNLVFSPIFSFSRNEVESAEGSDVVKDVLAGARLTWDGRWKALSWRTHLELGYRRQDNREQGRAQDWSQALGANLSLGNLESLLGSVSYSYSETDADISVPDFRDAAGHRGAGWEPQRSPGCRRR